MTSWGPIATVVLVFATAPALAVDSDGDGVADSVDACCRTPVGVTVDAAGQPVGDLDGDCDVDLDDFAVLLPDVELEHFGRFQNDFTGTLDPDGACVPECSEGPAARGKLVLSAQVPLNDSCASFVCTESGTIEFSTVGATTDGPVLPPVCPSFQDNHIRSDVWFCFAAPCDDRVVVSLCGSEFDTKLAVYEGCSCPPGPLVACSDDSCGVTTLGSRVSFDAQWGQNYLIRAGGFLGATGGGSLTVYCESFGSQGLNACGVSDGSCFAPQVSAACSDEQCCQKVCTGFDQYCCDVQWDEACVDGTDCMCNSCSACESSRDDCFSGHQRAGCEDPSCCLAVCAIDRDCCFEQWDDFCAAVAASNCN